MMKFSILKIIKINLLLFLILTILTGVIYPLSITLFSKILFKEKANGSLIVSSQGEILGSKLIAQNFSSPKYLIGRDLFIKGPSNFPFNYEEKFSLAKKRELFFLNIDSKNNEPVPCDLLFSSGSGVDPHISLESAYYQMERIAKIRGIPVLKVQNIITKYTENKFLGIFGENRVNVLLVNLELDGKI